MTKPDNTSRTTEQEGVTSAGVTSLVEVKNTIPATYDDDFYGELAAHAGEGVSNNVDDSIVPFLILAQDLTPEAKKRDPAYIDGLEPGMFFLRGTNKIWRPGEVSVIPCAFQKWFVEWVPRDNGGGYVGRHETLPPDAHEVPDPRDKTGKKMITVRANGNEIIETRYHFVLILADDDVIPAVTALSSTGHTASRQWMYAIQNSRLVNPATGQRVQMPSYFKRYTLGAVLKSNPSGEWFVPNFVDIGAEGVLTDKALRSLGKQLHDSVNAGDLRAGDENGADGAAGSSSPSDAF